MRRALGAPLRSGFTLIELLVVVLIIGILAAVALPQYQKTVNQARLTEWMTHVNTFYKGLDLWLLENGGYPSQNTRFSGDGSGAEGYIPATLDIEMPCVKNEDNWCYAKYGRFHVGCGSGGCYVDMSTNYDGYTGWLPKGENEVIWTSRYAEDDSIKLSKVPQDVASRKLICRFWKDHFGAHAMNERASTSCAEVGI